jgi:hypothetical protein
MDSIGADPPGAYRYPPPPPVQQSYATIAITPDPTCGILGPTPDPNGWNYQWYFFIPIQASWTLDTNNNGSVDRIRLLVLPGR